MQNVGQKRNWALTPSAFHGLLEWLGTGAPRAEDDGGQAYLDMRRRLVAYFDRKNCPAPDELADETLNRVARRLEEQGTIVSETPARYCFVVARYVFMEYWRGARRSEVPLESVLGQTAENAPTAPELEDATSREKLMGCLDRCTEKLEPQNRELIVGYYFGERRVKIENRRALAAKLGVSVNALSIRACRLRDKLEACVATCVGRE